MRFICHPPHIDHGEAVNYHAGGLTCTGACAVTVRDWMVQPRYHRTLVRLEDDGTIGLDWFRWRECTAQLPRAAPLLLVAHPITGGLPQSDMEQ